MEEERVFTISLRDAQRAKKYKRASEALKIVKDFLKRHLKVNEVKIDSSLNQEIWKKGAEKPPRKIKVKASKLDDVTAEATALK